MKKLIPIIILIFGIQEIFACCAGEMISIAPRNNEISQNPIILIDFMERDYKIYDKLEEARFYLIDDKGKKIDLEILERNEGFHTWAQILLRPKKKLKKGRNVSLRITEMQVEGEQQRKFVQRVQSKKWKVKFKKDDTAPKFNEEVAYEYINHFNWSASGHGILGTAKFWDNNEYKYEINRRIENQIIIEATSEEGERYLLTTNGNSFWIYQGICGATFGLKQDAEYSFKLRLIDFSGNKSLETKEVKFKTGNSRINRISAEEINKIIKKKN